MTDVDAVADAAAELHAQPAQQQHQQLAQPLQLIGQAGVVCEGDFCEIPAHHDQAVVNRMVDLGEI